MSINILFGTCKAAQANAGASTHHANALNALWIWMYIGVFGSLGMHILLNLLPRKPWNCIKWSRRNRSRARCEWKVFVRLQMYFIRWVPSWSGGCSCLLVCLNYTLLFGFLFCSNFRACARVHPLASCVCLPVNIVNVRSHIFAWLSYQNKNKKKTFP